MNTIALSAQKREGVGTKYAKITRNSGLIPAVVYGGNSEEHITVAPLDVRSLVYTADFNTVDLDIDGDKSKCIVKNVQFHPVTDKIIHMDFLKLVDGVPVKVEVPVKFKGVSPGVKTGGKLIQQIRKLKIKTLPADLVGEVVVDISELELGDVLRVKSVELPDSIQILMNGASPLANVVVPRALKGGDEEEEGATEEEAVEETPAE